ncbi:MAG: lipopolysaccharide biosynthesis protein [Pyrinomonadaceae bacterium]
MLNQASNQESKPPADVARVFVSGDDPDRHFRTDFLKDDLTGRSVRGGVVTVASQGLKFCSAIGATIILARLLTPADYGLIGMVAVVTGFVSMFKDMGLSVATIQKEEINAEQISTLFWINVLLSIAVMLVMVAIGPIVAWFYGEPRLTLITICFAQVALIGGLTSQHEALVRRQMRFTVLAVLEISSLIVGIFVAVALAWYGARYWALVASQLAQTLMYAVGIWIVCGWRPGMPVRNSGVRSMFAFGSNLTGFHVINYFARNLDNMLIGKFWGSWQLGLYGKAYQLLLLPIDQINSPIATVALPVLSRLTDSPERYRKAYLRILQKVAILTMPIMAFMIACSDWMVRLVLGPQWIDASRIFAVLGIVGMVQPIANTTGWLFMTQGRTRHMFQWGLIGSSIIISSIVLGLPWGAIGVATSYSLVSLLIVTPLLFWFVGREGPVRTMDFYRAVAPVAAAALSVLGILLILRQWLTVTRPLVGLLIGFVVTLTGTALILAASSQGRMALGDFVQLFSHLRKKAETRPFSRADHRAASSQPAI